MGSEGLKMYNVREVEFDELDVREWNELLSKSEVCDAFQTFEWAQVLRNSLDVDPLFLLFDDGGETIGGVMALQKKMFGIAKSYETRGGPLYIGKNGTIVMENILRVFQRKKRRSMYLLFIPFPLINSRFRSSFETNGYHPVVFRTIIIDLKRPLERIWHALEKEARWGVKKAERLGVKVEIAGTWKEWKEYYNLQVHHGRKKRYSTDPYSFFKEMFKLHSKGMSRLFIAKYEAQIIAGSLFLIYGKNMIFLQNASLDAFLSYNPNNLIQWKSIVWAQENGVETYDMNGLPLEETFYLRGVYEYKKRWDGSIQWYYYYLDNRLLGSAVQLVNSSFSAWRMFSWLRNHWVISR